MDKRFKLDDSFKKALEEAVVSDTPASSWMDQYREEYDKVLKSGMFFEFHPTWTGEWDKDKFAFCYNRGWEKTSPQDPAVCNYSGLGPVEGYQEEIDKEIIRVIIADLDTEEGKEKAEWFRRGWLAGYDKGLYDGQYKEDIDKEMKIDKGDINFMYKWIRSKSGK